MHTRRYKVLNCTVGLLRVQKGLSSSWQELQLMFVIAGPDSDRGVQAGHEVWLCCTGSGTAQQTC
jgi:hypothetical protein